MMGSKQFLAGSRLGAPRAVASNGSRLFMKQKFSMNVQITPGERESPEVSEKRFDREIMQAAITRELRRRQQFENPQDVKKRKVEEKKFRRRMSRGGRRENVQTWDQYFGGDLASLNNQFGGEDLEFKFLQAETNIPCNAFTSLFSEDNDL